jgi:hypothetical protein
MAEVLAVAVALADSLYVKIRTVKHNARHFEEVFGRVRAIVGSLQSFPADAITAFVKNGVLVQLCETLVAVAEFSAEFQRPPLLHLPERQRSDQERFSDVHQRLAHLAKEMALRDDGPHHASVDKAWELTPAEYSIKKRGVLNREVVLGKGTFGTVFHGMYGNQGGPRVFFFSFFLQSSVAGCRQLAGH